MDVLERTGALDYARRRAVQESEAGAAALAALPPSPHKENLLELASFAATAHVLNQRYGSAEQPPRMPRTRDCRSPAAGQQQKCRPEIRGVA